MPWTPVQPVIESRGIGANLLAFIDANQADALEWAHGTPLKPLARIENSVAAKNVTVYPAIQEAAYTDAMDTANTYPRGGCSVTFDIWVTDAVPADLKAKAISYDKAVKSMIRNCPNETAFDGIGSTINSSTLLSLEGSFDPIEMHDNGNSFLQRIQIRATYQIEGMD